ncbi:zinc finger CCHC domain-containing protein 7-like [Dendronephthya gigantea]|uniref:zinc finger CCHC domain-containing protein 7-like n=1 Tax=Dendronephthya gigantea TaxID=151771 RepID=UPI0010698C30|nr:zinc finger CCHC domain-containing protein 7-like [Dendronephthya gigantea]
MTQSRITCCEDSLDSELEAELYQSVHFASSLVETPTNDSKEEKVINKPNESTSLESQIEQCNFDSPDRQSEFEERKQLDQVDGPHNGQQAKDTSKNLYPEVELVFAKDEQKNKLCNVKGKTGVLFEEAKTDGGESDNGGLSDGNGWGIVAADMIQPVKKVKRLNVRCFNCNEKGHRTLECTAQKKEKVCWLCGEIGHLRKYCKNDLCFNCNRTGHQIKKCPQPRRAPHHRCRRCRAHGHFESFCPDRWRQYHHTINQGEMVQAIQPESIERQDFFCYNCGEKGHLGHECLEEMPFFSYRTFPFVVKYDRFTSKFSQVDGNNKTDGNTNLTSEPGGKKSKKKKRKRKRAAEEEAFWEEKKAGLKRKKLGDSSDTKDLSGNPRVNWRLSRENRCDQLETFTDFNHVTSNLPLQPLMDIGEVSRGKKKKRRKTNAHEHLAEEGPVKKKKAKPNRDKRKRLKKMKLQQKFGNKINLESPTFNSISASHSTRSAASMDGTPTTMNTSTRNATPISRRRYATRSATSISETHHTKSPTSATNPANSVTLMPVTNATKNATSNSSTLSTANAGTEENIVFQLGKEKRLLVIQEADKKPWRRKHKSAGNKRKVYYKYDGFL